MEEKKSLSWPHQSKTGRLSVVDIMATLMLCIALFGISWLLCLWFEKTEADEPVVFGSLAVLVVVALAFVYVEWRHHASIWIGLIQGAVISASAAIPVFRGEPDTEPIIGPLIIAVFGAVLGGVTILISWLAHRPPKLEVSQTIASPERSDLIGIRGWLILPAIGLAISPALGVIGIIAGLASLEKMLNRGYGAYFVPALIANVGMLIYLFVVAVRFFKKRKNAPQTFIRLMIIFPLVNILLFILGLAVIGSSDELVIVSLLRNHNFIATGIAAAIWIPYFKVSKRVKATFVD